MLFVRCDGARVKHPFGPLLGDSEAVVAVSKLHGVPKSREEVARVARALLVNGERLEAD